MFADILGRLFETLQALFVTIQPDNALGSIYVVINLLAQILVSIFSGNIGGGGLFGGGLGGGLF